MSVEPTIDAVAAGPARGAAAVMIDMPIGLSEDGARACETMARRVLSPRRHASVFPSPARAMLDCADYAQANALGKASPRGRGLPKQTWMIVPKIRELDAFITPSRQRRFVETHPEVAFARLNGDAPCAASKRTPEGREERVKLLRAAGVHAPEGLAASARRAVGRAGVGEDDVYDACALALSGRARLDGTAMRLTDGARDARGLVMEIWG